ncbi:MAG: DNA-deoxyinosine glycosylase [Proteocatella sp.]
MENYEQVTHELEPIYNQNSKILILGTLPSVKSREQQFFYAHPQNRFWKVLASLMEDDVPITIEDKKEFLLRNNIAVWDVIDSCQIVGSSDSSIKDVVPTDITKILKTANISKIFANGATAKKLYEKYQQKVLGIEIEGLPSTSPANAAYSLEKLIDKWSVIKLYMGK